MPALTVTKSYANASTLSESNLDDIKNSIETWANTTKLDDTNIQAGGIGTTSLAANAVTQVKRAALGQQISSSSGGFSTASSSAVDVTNLSVSLTTTGRPVWVGLKDDASGNQSFIEIAQSAGNQCLGEILLFRDATQISRTLIGTKAVGASATQVEYPSSAIWTIDTPTAGTYTYKAQGLVSTGTSASVQNTKLIAFEL